MSEKKWIVVPGTVKSKNDSDIHYISASRLMSLYRVNPAECIVVDPNRPETARNLPDLPVLRPDYHGKYKLPEKKES